MNRKWNWTRGLVALLANAGRHHLLSGCLVMSGLTASATVANAQTPAGDVGASKLPDKQFWTKSALFFPVNVEERMRSNIREIQLYVREYPSGQWQLKQQAPPTQSGFECRLARDGEYWFNVVTIDQFGRQEPADLNKEPPAQIIVLDSTAPAVDLKLLPQTPDGLCVKCEVRDANPNAFQTRFEYQTGDGQWRIVDRMSNQGDSYCIPRQAVVTGMVKITAIDRAMNTTTREFNLTALTNNTSAADAAAAPAKTVTQTANFDQAKSGPAQQLHQLAGGNGNSTDMAKPAASTTAKQKEPAELAIKNVEMTQVQPEVHNVTPQTSNDASSRTTTGKAQIVCQPRVSLDYRIEDEGKSGVGKVEVWITKDNGRTWDVLCEDADKKSPVVFDLPGEGTFGVRLSVTNGRGFGANPPKSGDVPDVVVELDTTKPQADLRSVKLGPADDACMDINWHASDKNLGPTPIDLFYSASQQGPWTPIAKGVPNNGKYRWYLPREVGSQAFVRMVVTDMAGNMTRCETSQSVALDDGTRPRAVIGNIVPVSMQVPPGKND